MDNDNQAKTCITDPEKQKDWVEYRCLLCEQFFSISSTSPLSTDFINGPACPTCQRRKTIPTAIQGPDPGTEAMCVITPRVEINSGCFTWCRRDLSARTVARCMTISFWWSRGI